MHQAYKFEHLVTSFIFIFSIFIEVF